MGGADPVSQAVSSVSNAVAPIIQPVVDFIKPVTAPINDATKELSRGDIGKYVGQTGTTFARAGTSLVEGTAQLYSGNFRGAGTNFGKTAGNVGNILTYGGQNFVGKDSLSQAVLRNPGVDKATLGISSDYAGFSRGGSTLSDSGEISNADRDSSLRLISKGVAGGLVIKGYQSLSATNKVIATSAGTAAAKGDTKGVVDAIAPGLGSTINNYLPQLPSAPSWIPIPDLSSVYDSFINPATSDGAPGANSSTPFNQSGASSSDVVPFASTPEMKSILVIGAVIMAAVIIKKGVLK